MSLARDRLLVALAGRRVVGPLTALALVAAGVFAYRPNEVQETWALTAFAATVLAGWLVAAIERDVGPGADAALAARAGGFAVAWRARCVLVAVAGALVAAVLVSWPLAIGAFDRPPGGADVTAAVTAHLACGAVGGALALLLAAPVRPGSALVVFLGAVIASAVAGVGPAGVADALADAPDREITGALLVASGVALALAGALAAAARVLGRYRG